MAISRRAALLAALLPLASCRPPLDEGTESRYVEIYNPFFAPARDEAGRKIYRAQRAGAFPSEFSAVKEKDVIRVFIVGGSVAQALGTNDDLVRLWRTALPSRRFEIINCGMPGYDSYRDGLTALEVLKYEPDLVVLLSGNNEFYRPVKINLLLYSTRLALLRLPPFQGRPDLPKPISPQRRLADLSAHLREIGAAARRRGVPLVYCTLPARADMPPRPEHEWKEPLFVSAWLALDRGRAPRAVELFSEYAAAHPQDAAAFHYLARAEEAAGALTDAARDDGRSLDLQEYRCGPAKNSVIRAVAAEGGILADLNSAFRALGRRGLAGGESLIDGVHWYQQLNGVAAAAILEAARRGAPAFAAAAAPPSAASVFQAAAPEDKARREIWFALKTVIGSPAERKEEEAVAALGTAFRLAPGPAERLLLSAEASFVQQAFKANPQESIARIANARPRLLEHAGEALRRMGRTRKAIFFFGAALRLDPQLPWARLHRALAETSLGRSAAARADFAAAREQGSGAPELSLFAELAEAGR